MFESKQELDELQHLLDESFARSRGIRYSGFGSRHRLSARQLAGFQGIRLVACATLNAKGEPRAAPRSAAFLHGRFYLASNSKSTMVKRLSVKPLLGITYYENRLLIIGHGATSPVIKGEEFKERRREWSEAFKGGHDALEGTDMLVRVNAEHLVAFATNPARYPAGWRSGSGIRQA